MKIYKINVLVIILAALFDVVTPIFTEIDGIYNETEARVLFELVAAVHNSDPQFCLKS